MKIANAMLTLRPGFVIPLFNITPAEAQFLTAEHEHNAKGNPLKVDEATISEVERTDYEELGRLKQKYNPTRLKAMYPKSSFRFPKDYAEASEVGMDAELPESKFVNEQDSPIRTTGDE